MKILLQGAFKIRQTIHDHIMQICFLDLREHLQLRDDLLFILRTIPGEMIIAHFDFPDDLDLPLREQPGIQPLIDFDLRFAFRQLQQQILSFRTRQNIWIADLYVFLPFPKFIKIRDFISLSAFLTFDMTEEAPSGTSSGEESVCFVLYPV